MSRLLSLFNLILGTPSSVYFGISQCTIPTYLPSPVSQLHLRCLASYRLPAASMLPVAASKSSMRTQPTSPTKIIYAGMPTWISYVQELVQIHICHRCCSLSADANYLIRTVFFGAAYVFCKHLLSFRNSPSLFKFYIQVVCRNWYINHTEHTPT